MEYAQLRQQFANRLIKEIERDLQLQPRDEECLLRAETASRKVSRFHENTKPDRLDLKLITGLRQHQAVHAEMRRMTNMGTHCRHSRLQHAGHQSPILLITWPNALNR